MEYENIISEKKVGIATITLNRPQALNSLTLKMVEEILDAISTAAADDEVRAVAITGAGRGFCADDDLWGMGTPPGGSTTEGMRQRTHMMIKSDKKFEETGDSYSKWQRPWYWLRYHAGL